MKKKRKEERKEEKKEEKKERKKVEKIDLEGIKCPLNFVRIKLKLKKLNPAERLLARLVCSEEDYLSVVKSLESERVKILGTELKKDTYFILLEK